MKCVKCSVPSMLYMLCKDEINKGISYTHSEIYFCARKMTLLRKRRDIFSHLEHLFTEAQGRQWSLEGLPCEQPRLSRI